MDLPVESVIGAIFSPDRTKILLIERRDVPVWVLPGGGVEKNETPENAIEREILEETGFTVKAVRLVGLYLPINRLSKRTHLYECSILKGSIQPNSETLSIRFFPVTLLPKKIPPPFPEWIQDALILNPPVCKKIASVNYLSLFHHFLLHPLLVVRFLLSRLGLSINSSKK